MSPTSPGDLVVDHDPRWSAEGSAVTAGQRLDVTVRDLTAARAGARRQCRL